MLMRCSMLACTASKGRGCDVTVPLTHLKVFVRVASFQGPDR